MGRNYYLYNWYGEQVAHLGKLSYGWNPTLSARGPWDSFNEFKDKITQHGHIIKDEYGEQIDCEDFLAKIKERKESDEQTREHGDLRGGFRDNGFTFIGGQFC